MMDYIKAIEILKEIEAKYDVMSVKYKGVSIWPYIRVYLVDGMSYNKARGANMSNIMLIIKSMFFYNIFRLLRKYDLWLFTSTVVRKPIKGKYYLHASGIITELHHNTLCFENPDQKIKHYRMDKIPDKHIVSNSILICLSRMYEYFIRIFSFRIDREDILQQINKDYSLDFNYKFRSRLLFAQRLAMDTIIFISRPPKAVFIECPYAQMGYIWSLHRHNIPVIEQQHGVLNANHYAYNSIYSEDILAPDEICVYGDIEYDYLTNHNNVYSKKVTRTGLYILDMSNKTFTCDIFFNDRKMYKKIIVVSGQTGFEEVLFNFITSVASRTSDYMFIYIPRRYESFFSQYSNVRIVYNVNIYEYLKWCDIHCTISSTTCLEAHYFNKPNIFYDINKTAHEYYDHILNKSNGCFYVANIEDFIKTVNECTEANFHYRTLFMQNNREHMNSVIERYL